MPAADLLRLIRAVLDDQKITRGGSDLPTPPQPAAAGRLWRTRPRARTKSVLMREPSNTFSAQEGSLLKSLFMQRNNFGIFFSLSAAKPLILDGLCASRRGLGGTVPLRFRLSCPPLAGPAPTSKTSSGSLELQL